MELDNEDVSVSYPIKTSISNSNGTIELSISDVNLVASNGYRLRFIQSDNTFIIERVVNDIPSENMILNNNNGIWEGIFQGISIKITAGTNPFIDNDQFSYSSYATQNPEGKLNVLNISNQPFDVFVPF